MSLSLFIKNNYIILGDFTILGLTVGGFVAAVLLFCLVCCYCREQWQSIRTRLRALNPRWEGGERGEGPLKSIILIGVQVERGVEGEVVPQR